MTEDKTICETTVYMYARVTIDTVDDLLGRIAEMRQKDTRISKILAVSIHIVEGKKLGYNNEPSTVEFYEAIIRVEYDENKFHNAQNSPATEKELDLWARNASS
jgi:hypothetical protein